ncbi:hypothetical protein G6F59_016378 [Rhizopus arrhizus]|nr:hypothetical protein G6F59_016378 [Rhizopus arrhizus]
MAYASGDVDAIFGGSAETFTRDLQWKAFTPVLMGMSGWSSNARKHPWWYDEPYRSINRDYLKLKMRLTPYMYGLVHEAAQTGAPPVLPARPRPAGGAGVPQPGGQSWLAPRHPPAGRRLD